MKSEIRHSRRMPAWESRRGSSTVLTGRGKSTARITRLCVALIFLGSMGLQAYPEFQTFIVAESRKPVNCAFCHSNADGPEGTAPGQIGHLNAAEQERLGRARAALLPGQTVDSPILNEFGNHIVKSVGKTKFLELKLAPAELAGLLPKQSDLDHDGISDAQEYLAGTHPVNRHDGHPWLLFKHNFRENIAQIALTLAATIAGMWGLTHLLRGFATATRLKEEEE